MAAAFNQLIADIEREAHEEGPRAVRELEQFRREFALAGAHIAIVNGSPGDPAFNDVFAGKPETEFEKDSAGS